MANEKEILEQLSRQLHLAPGQIKSSAEKGDVGDLMKNVDSTQAKQVESILSDPEKTRELLNSPQAQALLKMLNKE